MSEDWRVKLVPRNGVKRLQRKQKQLTVSPHFPAAGSGQHNPGQYRVC